ncbi:uncharacterized protein LOC121800954 [Salvia splendens]|uniref:uncharacterized protein LOC121800954 n=1 Tax=Salvia splendens TaxID=180675 RepID=UPI001C262508|nr:uncharacterized protein LOC121800954 [Salvia splendens]
MGKKAFATKIKPPSSRREENRGENPGTQPPPNPQPSAPTQQAPPMISLDAMAEFLRLQDPTRNWAAELANFSQIRGQGNMTAASPAVAMSVTSAHPTVQPPPTDPFPPTIPQEEHTPVEAAIAETEKLSPVNQDSEPLNDEAILAYYDSDPEERAERLRKENQDREGGNIAEETPTVETVRQERVREEIDLNELAQKRSLMTDTEFESIVEEVNRREDTALIAEGLDLASRSVGRVEKVQGEEKESEPVDPRVEVGDSRMQVGEEEPAAETQEPEPVAPPVVKPKPIKRSLILKTDPKAIRPKPQRVSQRCLGKSVGHRETGPTTQDPFSSQAEKEPEEEKDKVDREEVRYSEERKRKGKAPMKKKPSIKKPRLVNIGIVITEAAQRTPSSRRE